MREATIIKTVSTAIRMAVVSTCLCALLCGSTYAQGSGTKSDAPLSESDLVPLKLKLPRRMSNYNNSHYNIESDNLEEPRKGERPPFMVPKGTVNLALNKKVASSDSSPILGEAEYVTDGNKEGPDGSLFELNPGLQYVQIDLEEAAKIYAIVVWRYHPRESVFKDVIVQISNEVDFKKSTTIFNNDHDNSADLGKGKDKEYLESHEGKIIDAGGVEGRYVRLYSNGNNFHPMNHYIEVEVYGKPTEIKSDLVPLKLESARRNYTSPRWRGIESDNLEEPRKGRRPPFMVPKGTANLALNKNVTSSDSPPIFGETKFVTDGDKAVREESYVEFAPGVQHVQIDLEETSEIHAVVVWRFCFDWRAYKDVIVQVSNDPEFKKPTTIFNNDHDNSAGLGKGKDKEFIESTEGKIIDAGGVKGRYLRLYSNGNDTTKLNHYHEVEVYGKPIVAAGEAG